MFTKLERGLLIMRQKHEWSTAVQAAVEARRAARRAGTVVPSKHLHNFVFFPDFAPGYDNVTAFVPSFDLSELEYCLLQDLGAMRQSTENDKQRLQKEFTGKIYKLDIGAQSFVDSHKLVFDDFSHTTVVHMKSLVHGSGTGYFWFYQDHYLPKLSQCRRSETCELHDDMKRLKDRLIANEMELQARASRQPVEPCRARHPGETRRPGETQPCRPTPALLGVKIHKEPYTDPPTPRPHLLTDNCTPNRYTPNTST
jgi:hypothetical protein